MSVVTPEGLDLPTLQEIADDLGAQQRASVDPLLITDVNNGDSVIAQLNGPFASALREVYEALGELADAIDPNKAEDERQDVVNSITGSTREKARPSTFTGPRRIKVNLDAGKLLAAGKQFAIVGHPEYIYETTEDCQNTTAGTANVLVSAASVKTGPIPGNAGTLTVILSSESGLNSVTNPFDCVLGADVEDNETFRLRRGVELRGGATNSDAIRAALIAMKDSNDPSLQPILEAFVIANSSDSVSNGVPPHGFECVIWDGPGASAADADVAKVIWDNTDPGDNYSGTSSATILDSYGFSHVVKFSRCEQLAVWIRITLQYNPKTYAGDNAVKTAVADSFQTGTDALGRYVENAKQRPAKEVDFSPYMAVASSVAGVARIATVEMRFGSDPYVAWTPLAVGLRQIGVTDTSQIEIVSTSL